MWEKSFDELKKSEKKYRTIFEFSRDAIVLTDLKGRIIEINQAGIKILGYKNKDELQTLKTAGDLFADPQKLTEFQNRMSLSGFVKDFEARLLGRQGRIFDALVTSSVTADDQGCNVGLVVIIRDIDKIKLTAQRIEKQNARLATLNAISITVSSSLDLKEILNKSIEKILNILISKSIRIYLLDETKTKLILTAHQGLSKKFIAMDYIKNRKFGDGLLGQTILTGQTSIADNVIRSSDPYMEALNQEGLKSTIYIPLSSQGKMVGVMCVSSYSRVQYSDELVEFLSAIGRQIGMAIQNANLYKGMQNAYQELKDAQEQVIRSEKLASLGKLAATIAHEINNPLAAVLTYSRLLMKLMQRKLFGSERLEDIKRYLETIERETSRCGEIVKNLLDFSRQTNISVRTHQIEDIINRAIALLKHELEINNIQLVKNIDPDIPMIKCDFKQIQQVLLNLMSNAAEAMPHGGVLNITARPVPERNHIEVVISDTGEGILPRDQENIFEPFFTTKEEGKGVGLGLSVVYGIITKHQGTIRVVTQPDQGCSFYVELPQAWALYESVPP